MSRRMISRACMLVLLAGIVASMSAFAGSAVIGSVAGSSNATVGGQTLLPNTTLFSGDSLRVNEGVAVIAIGNGSRMVFGRDTTASFLRDEKEVTVLLGQGFVSMYHPEDSVAMRVKVGDISVLPATGFKTLGEVAMLNGTIVVTTKEGSLRVEESGKTVEVAKGKTIAIPTQTARAPQAGAAGHIAGATVMQGVGVAASGASVVTSTVAEVKAGNAESAANNASSTASSAVTAANSAASAASTANSNVTVAGSNFTKLCTAISTALPTAGVKC